MTTKEIEIKDISVLPNRLFHLVPEKLFGEFSDQAGNYDCRNKKDWGNNSAFIHTSPTKRQLKERVADLNWVAYPIEEAFLLLEIDPQKIESKITSLVINNHIYHHIWGQLPAGSYNVSAVSRSADGKFLL